MILTICMAVIFVSLCSILWSVIRIERANRRLAEIVERLASR